MSKLKQVLWGLVVAVALSATATRADVPEYDIKIPGSKELRIPYSEQNFKLNFSIDNPNSRRYYHVILDRDGDAEKFIKVIATQHPESIYERNPSLVLRFFKTFWVEYQRTAPSYKDIKFKVRYLQEEPPKKDGQCEIILEKRPAINLGEIEKYFEVTSNSINFNERAKRDREIRTECSISWKGSDDLSDQTVLCRISFADNEKYFTLQGDDKKSDKNDLVLRFDANSVNKEIILTMKYIDGKLADGPSYLNFDFSDNTTVNFRGNPKVRKAVTWPAISNRAVRFTKLVPYLFLFLVFCAVFFMVYTVFKKNKELDAKDVKQKKKFDLDGVGGGYRDHLPQESPTGLDDPPKEAGVPCPEEEGYKIIISPSYFDIRTDDKVELKVKIISGLLYQPTNIIVELSDIKMSQKGSIKIRDFDGKSPIGMKIAPTFPHILFISVENQLVFYGQVDIDFVFTCYDTSQDRRMFSKQKSTQVVQVKCRILKPASMGVGSEGNMQNTMNGGVTPRTKGEDSGGALTSRLGQASGSGQHGGAKESIVTLRGDLSYGDREMINQLARGDLKAEDVEKWRAAFYMSIQNDEKVKSLERICEQYRQSKEIEFEKNANLEADVRELDTQLRRIKKEKEDKEAYIAKIEEKLRNAEKNYALALEKTAKLEGNIQRHTPSSSIDPVDSIIAALTKLEQHPSILKNSKDAIALVKEDLSKLWSKLEQSGRLQSIFDSPDYFVLVKNKISPLLRSLFSYDDPQAVELLRQLCDTTRIEKITPKINERYNEKMHEASRSVNTPDNMYYVREIICDGLKYNNEPLLKAEVIIGPQVEQR